MTEQQLSPNRLVSYNLARARALRGWTQEEAAGHLEPFMGARWSKASFSAAERSVGGPRVREFTADELVAMSAAFGLPLTWWFMPPGVDMPDAAVEVGTVSLSQAALVEMAYGDPEKFGSADYSARVTEFYAWAGFPSDAALGAPDALLQSAVGQVLRDQFTLAATSVRRLEELLTRTEAAQNDSANTAADTSLSTAPTEESAAERAGEGAATGARLVARKRKSTTEPPAQARRPTRKDPK